MSARRILKLSSMACLMFALAAGSGCARYRSTSRPVQIDQQEKNERVYETNEDAVKAGVYEDFVDSSALKSGEIPPPAAEPVPSVPATEPSPAQVPPNVTIGYRIQLGAFNDMEGAQELAEKARASFGSLCPVYVRFYSPYWKVQAGDCATRAEAESLRSFLRGKGYPDSFIVQAGIQN